MEVTTHAHTRVRARACVLTQTHTHAYLGKHNSGFDSVTKDFDRTWEVTGTNTNYAAVYVL
jgi:phage gpG-like protein